MYIDIHVHNDYKDKDTIILRNIFPEKIKEIEPSVYYSIGLHPWYIEKDLINETIAEIEKAAVKKNVIAIGETGLDHKIEIPFDIQTEAFQKQIIVAEKFQKPVIIHCVGAYNELLSFRKRSDQNIPWIIHWFNSGIEIASDLISKNCYLSFGISLFKEESKAFKAFKELPHDKIFFETDDVGIKINQVYDKAAFCLNISEEKLQNQIKKNFMTCFGKDI